MTWPRRFFILAGMDRQLCSKCKGTGYRPEHARIDGGRCWHCGPSQVLAYYTDAEFEAVQAAQRAERMQRRAARRSA